MEPFATVMKRGIRVEPDGGKSSTIKPPRETNMPSTETLYRINDVLSALYAELSVADSTGLDGLDIEQAQELIDETLQAATLAVGEIFYGRD